MLARGAHCNFNFIQDQDVGISQGFRLLSNAGSFRRGSFLARIDVSSNFSGATSACLISSN
jgi:hypothetical protein